MVVAIIPARYASSRFPGKPLAIIAGRSMISRVYERVLASTLVQRVVVATDDARIYKHVLEFGGRALMTGPDHTNGTSRVAEAAAALPGATIVVNVQGDEPFIDPGSIDQLVATFNDPLVDIATLAHPIFEQDALLSPHVVKVVRSTAGRALYFSRHAVPYLRDVPVGQWVSEGLHLQHIGLYAYRAPVLARLIELPPHPLEAAESLEQLRWLAGGLSIQVEITDTPSRGIDTPEDLRAAEDHLRRRAEKPIDD